MAILVDKNTIIPAGPFEPQFSNEYDGNRAFLMTPPYSDPFSTAPINFTNNGDLRFVAPASVYWNVELISVATNSFWVNGRIANYGTIYVGAPGGTAYAIRANSWSPALLNNGSITVESKTQTIGFESWGFHQNNTSPLVENNGQFITRSDGRDFTLYLANGGDVVNTGLIYAYSGGQGDGASAISFPNGGGYVFNTGQIIAEDADNNTSYATAINFFGLNEVHIVNSGTIRGDYALNEHNKDNSPYLAATTVENSGTIIGRIYLGDGDDVLVNSGTINGLLELGSENDTYDGRGGHVVQAVMAGDGDDVMMAGLGTEVFFGEAGDDVFYAGEGAATFLGGDGYDLANYSFETRAVTISLEIAGIQSIGSNASTTLVSIEDVVGSIFGDTLTGNASGNLLLGLNGDDWLYGKGGSDGLSGGGGADHIDGGDGDDALSGNLGDDVLAGGAGADVFFFLQGDGRDTITDFDTTKDKIDLSNQDGFSSIQAMVQDGADVVVTLSGSDSIRVKNVQVAALQSAILLLDTTPKLLVGDAGANHLQGGVANDTLNGLAGNDILDGGRGDDLLNGGSGNNVINGGEGVDTVTYADADGAVGVFLSRQEANGLNLSDRLSSIENAIGSRFQDVLHGGAEDNRFWGGDGDDGLYGNGGDDLLDGGLGADTANYFESTSGVVVDLSQTGAQNTVGAGVDTLVSIEYLIGSNYGDVLMGDAGANRLEGRGGADLVIGGLGQDYLDGGDGLDIVSYETAPSGVTVNLGQPNAQNTGGGGVDTLVSIEGLRGSAFADVLRGDGAVNVLEGLAADDVLQGFGGADALTGGAGADTFVYAAFGDSVAAASDLIADFVAGVDRIDLTALAVATITVVRMGGLNYVQAADNAGHVLQVTSVGAVNAADVVSGGTETGRLLSIYGPNNLILTQIGYDAASHKNYMNLYTSAGALFEQDGFDTAGRKTFELLYSGDGSHAVNTYIAGLATSQTGFAPDAHILWANGFDGAGVLVSQVGYDATGAKIQQIDLAGDGGRTITDFAGGLMTSQAGFAADGHRTFLNNFNAGVLVTQEGFDASGSRNVQIDLASDGGRTVRTFAGSVTTSQLGYAADGHPSYANYYDAASGALIEQDGFNTSGAKIIEIDHNSDHWVKVSHFDASGSLSDATQYDDASHLLSTLVRDPASGAYTLSGAADWIVLTAITGMGTINPAGANTDIVLHTGFGWASIDDFDTLGADHDVIRVDHALAADYAQLLAAAQNVGDDVVITFDPGNVLNLHNLQLSQLSAGDFGFL